MEKSPHNNDAALSDLDGLFSFDHARRTAQTACEENPQDADNLIKWGIALMGMSRFMNRPKSKEMLQDAIKKLEEASKLDRKKTEAKTQLKIAKKLFEEACTETVLEKNMPKKNKSRELKKTINIFGCFKPLP